MLYMSAQTGFIQIGEDSLFIQPVGVHEPSESFSGLKHQLLRHQRSTKTDSTPHGVQNNYCGTVKGEWHTDWVVEDMGHGNADRRKV